jgi:hypothetical protein
VTFDDPNLVANAGLLLVATLVSRLGLENLCNSTIHLGGRTGGFQPGRKILTLVHAMVSGASHIDHADMLRAGSTATVLPHRVMAPSTLGTFLRSFTNGTQTPTSSSWLNLVERWFRDITTKRIRRGSFGNVGELVNAIEDYIAHNNENPNPFVWTKTARQIITKVRRGRVALEHVRQSRAI